MLLRPCYWGRQWAVFPPSAASLGSEHHLKSKIKNPSARSRPAFAANGHLTQLNGRSVGSVTGSVQELALGWVLRGAGVSQRPGLGGRTVPVRKEKSARPPPLDALSQASPHRCLSVGVAGIGAGTSVCGCSVPCRMRAAPLRCQQCATPPGVTAKNVSRYGQTSLRAMAPWLRAAGLMDGERPTGWGGPSRRKVPSVPGAMVSSGLPGGGGKDLGGKLGIEAAGGHRCLRDGGWTSRSRGQESWCHPAGAS